MSAPVQVRACFRKRSRRARSCEILCLIGHDVRVSTERLEAFCFKESNEEDKELVYLAGVVAFADRTIRRHRSKGWRRYIHVVMPVGNPAHWDRPSVISSLQDALGYLTGDAWRFEFEQRTEALPKLKQQDLDLGDTNTVVVPFSNGMDSFAQSKLLAADGFDGTPIRITAANSGIAGDRDWVNGEKSVRYRRVSLPFKIATSNHAEPTYRSRTFAFAAMAGLAAHLAGSSCIVVPEAGQGSFGPSLVPVGGESPHRGSHPGFSRRMTTLFYALWGRSIPFKHPQLWRTKGEVLRRLKDLNLHDGWDSTHSCSQGPRQIHTARHKLIHCGLCSGCLLRRVSVFTAGLTEPDDFYFWKDLGAPSLKAAICEDAQRPPTKNDLDIAVHAVMAMESLARAADASSDNLMFKQNLFEAFVSSELVEAEIELRRLINAHRDEWRAFTATLGRNAWINQQIAIL